MKYEIYMDVCCLNRPFDDLEQERIRLEAEAVATILKRCEDEQWFLVSSDAISFEIANTPNREKAERVNSILQVTSMKILTKPEIESRADLLVGLGFKFLDALHIAFAEAADVTVMLTTDDRLLRRAKKYSHELQINIENPVAWLMSTIQKEQDNEIS
jgi:predicted nucleic acid-binding protein